MQVACLVELNVEASKAAHNLISKWVIGCPIRIVRAKLILQLPGPYYFRRMGGSLGKHFFPLQQWVVCMVLRTSLDPDFLTP